MNQETMCLYQFIRPEPLVHRKDGWGWCARRFDDGRIVYCKNDDNNEHCNGYISITVSILEVME